MWVDGSMRGVAAATIVACVVSLPPVPAAGQPSFTPLGMPAGWERVWASDVSADGSVVAGWAEGPGVASAAFRWTRQGGIQFLDGLAAPSQARHMSSDGSVIVGTVGHERPEAFRWSESAGVVRLGRLAGNRSEAYDVSDNGVIVGVSTSPNHMAGGEAFRWAQAGGMVGLGALEPATGGSEANAVSADGSVVVGSSAVGTSSRAFRWTAATGMVPFGDAQVYSATGISADGRVIVGTWRVGPSGSEGFRWSDAEGFVGLGPWGRYPRGVSADGSVIVGQGFFGPGRVGESAFIWDGSHGMRDLNEVLVDELGLGPSLTGWKLTFATEVSPDGRFIVGVGTNPAGVQEGWLVTVPEPAGPAYVVAAAALLVRRRA